jgi:histone H3/H4
MEGRKRGLEEKAGHHEDAGVQAIPRASVKRIMKLENDIRQVQQEAVVIVSKAMVIRILVSKAII